MRRAKNPKFGSIVAVFAVCLFALPAFASDRTLSASEGWRMANDGRVAVFDVRSEAEWRRTGVAKGARTVTIHQKDGAPGFVRAMARALDGDKSKPIALICARGNRSKRALAILQNAGFTNVYNISEGMLGRGEAKGWIRNGLPVERCTRC